MLTSGARLRLRSAGSCPTPDGRPGRRDHRREGLQHYIGVDDRLASSTSFSKISVQEWEAAGDWFLDQFTNVMDKMKASRKEKRNIIAQFEEEISAREGSCARQD